MKEFEVGQYVYNYSSEYEEVRRLEIVSVHDGGVQVRKKLSSYEYLFFHEISCTKQEAFEKMYMMVADKAKLIESRLKELERTNEYRVMKSRERIKKVCNDQE
jgi:hypothetical protein